jgi:hypothetical protein
MSTQDPRAAASPGAAPDVVPLVSAPLGAATGRNGSAASTAPAASTGAAALGAVDGAVTCTGCGAPLAPDQRYCLACGQPASPVRLAFLDVLQGEYHPAAGSAGIPTGPTPVGYYAPPSEPDGFLGALRRYSGLLALTGVLLAALLVGLLVGHWITGGSGTGAAAGKQVIEVKGLSGALAAAPASGTSTPGGSGSSSDTSSSSGSASKGHSPASEAKKEAKEVKEVKAAKAPPVVHKKTSAQSLQKLNKTTGKQHAKEVNELIKGDEPIETGH